MPNAFETKACDACASAKRKCGKQSPCCGRCWKRGIQCRYPPAKPTAFVLCPGEDTFQVKECCESRTTQSSVVSEFDIFGYSCCPVENELLSNWFTAPDTWEIVVPREQANLQAMDFAHFVSTVRRWLRQWVEAGSNPFVHHRLYATRFPRCVQDAYMTLSCYFHKTASNEQAIFKIVEDRSQQLLQEHSSSLTLSKSSDTPSLDCLQHIARVHALLVYQFLGLYDGNIRMRHLAESRIPIMSQWKQQMVECAKQATCLGLEILTSAEGLPTEDHLWYSWILAESVRRTWLVASGIQAMYMIMQENRHDLCHGGMMFTTRKGVWEAPSAMDWEQRCLEINIGLMQMAEAISFLTELSPQDVDEFAKSILEVNIGIEKAGRWSASMQEHYCSPGSSVIIRR